MDPGASTLSTAMVRIFLLSHLCLVDCELDTICFKEPLLPVVKVFACNFSVTIPILLVSRDVQLAANVLVLALNSIKAGRIVPCCIHRTDFVGQMSSDPIFSRSRNQFSFEESLGSITV